MGVKGSRFPSESAVIPLPGVWYLMELHLSPRILSKQFSQGTSSSWRKISSAHAAALHLKQQ